jgi:hypothetical protein
MFRVVTALEPVVLWLCNRQNSGKEPNKLKCADFTFRPFAVIDFFLGI